MLQIQAVVKKYDILFVADEVLANCNLCLYHLTLFMVMISI